MRVPTNSFYRSQMENLTAQYQSLARVNQQITSQKKLLSSADDPVLAHRINQTEGYLLDIASYSQSAASARDRAQLHESATQQASTLLDQIQQLVIRSRDDTLSDKDRSINATQMQGMLQSLLNLANSQDGTGEYIFSGFNSGSPAYQLQGGSYKYLGGFETTSINIADGVTALYNESGYNVFGDIYNGNGVFTASANTGNIGTGYTDAGVITDPAAFVADTYTITFVTNSAGDLAYQVTGASSGQVIPAPPATSPANAPAYTAGQKIIFNGITMTMNGMPGVGDTFQLQPSTKQNVFDTIQGIINSLNTSTVNNPQASAIMHQNLAQGAASLQQAYNHVASYHAEVGTRTAVIINQINSNNSNELNQAGIVKDLQDIDMYEALSNFQALLLQLQATQGSYSQMQKMMTELFRL